MKYEEFETEFEPLGNRAEADGDVYFACFFSKEQDGYNAFWQSRMNFGDALLIIEGLINSFQLSAEAIVEMMKNEEQ